MTHPWLILVRRTKEGEVLATQGEPWRFGAFGDLVDISKHTNKRSAGGFMLYQARPIDFSLKVAAINVELAEIKRLQVKDPLLAPVFHMIHYSKEASLIFTPATEGRVITKVAKRHSLPVASVKAAAAYIRQHSARQDERGVLVARHFGRWLTLIPRGKV